MRHEFQLKGLAMDRQKFYFLINEARRRNVRFLRCEGRVYEVRSHSFPTGPSPTWSVDEVVPADVTFVPDPHYEAGC
jgi:hypothetical protein